MNFINKQIFGLDSQMIGSLNSETDDKIGSSLHKSFRSSYLKDFHMTVEYKLKYYSAMYWTGIKKI